MRTFRWVLFLLLLLVLQTVIFPRLNLFGIYPDSFLVAVVVVAVTAESTPALLLAGFLGFLQDILSVGIYLNTMIKVMAGLVVANINREFVGDRGRLALGLTALISPAVVLLESLFYAVFLEAKLDLWYILLKLIVQTGMNLLLVPVFFWLTEKLVVNE